MRRTVLLALILASPLLATAAPKRPSVAVMDIRPVQGVPAGTATLITDVVVTEISRTRRFDVVSNADIVGLLGLEKQKRLLQCDDDSGCLAELGGALGVDYLLSGTVGLLGSRLRISMSLQSVKRARVVAREARFCEANEDALVKATEETVEAVLAEIDGSVAGAPRPGAAATSTEPPAKAEPASPKPVLVPAPPASRGEPLATKGTGPDGPKPQGISRRTWGMIVGGAGVALLAAGGGFDAVAWSAYGKQNDAAAAGDRAAYDDALSKGRTSATMANVFYGTGLATAGVGAWLWFGGSTEPRVAVVPMAGGALLTLGGVLP